ncbi:peptide/nickel transport system permease protein [Stackebrandtia albiflava]|uniref:Peptide/nickel transport system permease protein n=1 Tax=Stackebrandtia albiflava TaxID=406432 RepID=A0A562V4I5_9ACTN|nr:ABC transporter permease [Stackebrandtia albiflava]TWJ12796.1 peptide/nickel transport system permease protein [Stackebrandtia albiflava]
MSSTTEAPVDAKVGSGDAITSKERTQFEMVVRRFMRHRLAVTSLILLVLLLLIAFVGPLFYKWGYEPQPGEIPIAKAPSGEHWFGTTRKAQDLLGLIIRGTQQSLKIGLLVAVLDIGIGAVWGAVAGLFRGWVDAIMMRIVDVIFVVPFLAVVAAVSTGINRVTWLEIALLIGLLGWGTTARLVRGQVLSLREQEFIEAARAVGASNTRIVFRHLLPNVTGIILVSATLAIVSAILLESALSFLGFGIQAPDTSLGSQVSDGAGSAQNKPWLFYFPGITLVLICLTFNFIGDGLRDAFDPRQTLERK